MKTISVLIERGLPDHKLIAASHDRDKLIARAQEHCLSLNTYELNRYGHAKADDLSECAIEEVEIL